MRRAMETAAGVFDWSREEPPRVRVSYPFPSCIPSFFSS
jgi:hypothetical protein